ncbi:hypothetical protein [Saccharopolyspora pogona]|uniref:hypothetical protein n=1 Tax=Saccharopolyspora pogona TaxID=333966 RepID=UPI001684056B|nr:hypothetical protein [Saccharopolyspora pogona]
MPVADGGEAAEVYWADSTDRRNTSIMEVLSGATAELGGGCDGKGCDAFAGPPAGGAA